MRPQLRRFVRKLRTRRDVEDLELDAVRVVEEERVVARDVGVLLRGALDLRSAVDRPPVAVVDDLARGRLERDVVDADAVTVVPPGLCASRTPTTVPPPAM
jgi:hypothetical protein